MKVALVHDFLTQLGGAERVLEELRAIFPKAPVYTLVYDEQKTEHRYRGWEIKTSFLQGLPGCPRHYKWYLPLMPTAIESLDLQEYDLIISDASAYAKGVRIRAGAQHICYCHTPTRYLWQDMDSYVASSQYPGVIKMLVKPLLRYFRTWDRKAAQRPDILIANSEEVRTRITKYYQRDSRIIYPPVNTELFYPPAKPAARSYFLAAGRLEPYKRFDIVIDACQRLNLPLKVAGGGTLLEKFRSERYGTEFLGRVSDAKLRECYQHAWAFIFPALEDAGMMIVEALACGTPVIAYRGGGALEFIKGGQHGEFFEEQTAESLISVLKNYNFKNYTTATLIAQARKFGSQVFRDDMIKVVNQSLRLLAG